MLGERAQVFRQRLVGDAELAEERAVDDQVGKAADRTGEVAVRRAREARMAEVARVVARLLQRAQDERRERLPPATGLHDVLGHPLASLGGDARSCGGRELLRHRRGRNVEVGELGK